MTNPYGGTGDLFHMRPQPDFGALRIATSPSMRGAQRHMDRPPSPLERKQVPAIRMASGARHQSPAPEGRNRPMQKTHPPETVWNPQNSALPKPPKVRMPEPLDNCIGRFQFQSLNKAEAEWLGISAGWRSICV